MNLKGDWQLSLENPADENMNLITKEAVIKCDTPIGKDQRFRIYDYEKSDDGVSAKARPVFFDAAKDAFILDKRPTDKTGQAALDIITQGTGYTAESDITDICTAYYVRKNLIEAINGSDENSFINRWGGEPVYQNEHLIINRRYGSDKGAKASFGNNLESITETVNMENVVTRIIPMAYNGYMMEGDTPWVDSPNIGKYELIYTKVIEFNDVKLQEYVDNGFKELFFNIPLTERPEYNGLQLINSAVILRYIKQLLRNDLRYAPFTFTASEKFVDEEIEIKTPKGVIKSRIGGIIDRMDTKDNTLRIVDYKTGGDAQCPPDVKSLFIQDKKRSNYIFQTFMYASIVCKKLRKKNNLLKVAPSLLYIHKAASENYSPVVQMGEARKKEDVDDFSIHEDEFREDLNILLEEIFNPETSFSQTEIEEKCQYCDYKDLCKK